MSTRGAVDSADSARVGALASSTSDDVLRVVLGNTLQVIGDGLAALSPKQRIMVNGAVVAGGRIELRVAVGIGPPEISLLLYDIDGIEIELGHARMIER